MYNIVKGTFIPSECRPKKLERHSYLDESVIFITKIKKIKRNKLIAISFKTFIIKVFRFILSNLLSV